MPEGARLEEGNVELLVMEQTQVVVVKLHTPDPDLISLQPLKKALQCATPPAQRCLKREHLTPTVQWVPALETARAREVTVRVSGREIRIQCFCFQSDFYDCSLSRCRRAADGRRRLNYKCALRSPPLFPLR